MTLQALRALSRGPVAAAAVASAAALAGGCSMVGSNLVPFEPVRGCHSHLGAYFLPKDHLHVEVREKPKPPGNTYSHPDHAAPHYEIVLIEHHAKADRTRGYCLDYLASPNSNDYLEVERSEGLLTRVATTNRAYTEFGKSTNSTIIQTQDTTEDTLKAIQSSIDATFNKLAQNNKVPLKDQPTQPWATKTVPPAAIAGGPAKPSFSGQFLCDGIEIDKTPGNFANGGTAFEKGLCSEAANEADGKPGTGTKQRLVFPAEGPPLPDLSVSGDRDQTNRGERRRRVDVKRANGALEPRIVYLRSAVDYNGDSADTAFSDDFDPADPVDAAAHNSGLKQYGLCMILGDGKVEIEHRDTYCDDPLAYAFRKGWKPSRATAERREGKAGELVNYERGLLYKPRISYVLYVFQKKDRKRHGGWKLAAQHTVRLANLSPMVSVGVHRTLFSTRNTALDFDRGALVNAAIDKRSELLGAVEIPLALMKTAVAIPTNVFKLRISQTTNLTELVAWETRLAQEEENYNIAQKRLLEVQNAAKETGGAADPLLNTPPTPAPGAAQPGSPSKPSG